ncbi:hypothetical protein AC625_09085 [Peribacillus loiseleuriae]|uniref:Uncharacterized protein n=1 Tax=Peribacillus loiseleuriae TaxID=1679170 RepID=A0A0K9GSQ7_9BACI|nr:hypothetical protein AC625_09085 [Peribacillus loiseleuriae]
MITKKEWTKLLDKQDKRRAFQEADQSFKQAQEAMFEIVKDGPEYGSQLKHVKQEMDEAYQQIQSALQVASEQQREQLQRYQEDLQSMIEDVEQS